MTYVYGSIVFIAFSLVIIARDSEVPILRGRLLSLNSLYYNLAPILWVSLMTIGDEEDGVNEEIY